MEPRVPQHYTDSLKEMVGSLQNFRAECRLLINTYTQTAGNHINNISNNHVKSEREKELKDLIEQKIEAREKIEGAIGILSKIRKPSARNSALFKTQPLQNLQYAKNAGGYNDNNGVQFNSNKTRILSPRCVNSINTTDQTNGSPTESVKYTIIAEGSGNHNEPIEVQLAEDDGALNLNSSADSERLEICSNPEESIEIKAEHNNSRTAQHQTLERTINSTPYKKRKLAAAEPNINATPATYHPHKKGKLAAAEHHQMISTNLNNYQYQTLVPQINATPYEKNKLGSAQQHIQLTKMSQSYNMETSSSFNNVQQNIPNQTGRISEIILSKISQMQSNSNNRSPNIQATPIQNETPYQENSNNLSEQSADIDLYHDDIATTSDAISLGPHKTCISKKVYEKINWSSASLATKQLLMATFSRDVLATHSMSGKASPAFRDQGKPVKQGLNPYIVEDIIYTVTRKCNVSAKEVRFAITSKCADDNKMMKKRRSLNETNKENEAG